MTKKYITFIVAFSILFAAIAAFFTNWIKNKNSKTNNSVVKVSLIRNI